jgi:hypothetical protein
MMNFKSAARNHTYLELPSQGGWNGEVFQHEWEEEE